MGSTQPLSDDGPDLAPEKSESNSDLVSQTSLLGLADLDLVYDRRILVAGTNVIALEHRRAFQAPPSSPTCPLKSVHG